MEPSFVERVECVAAKSYYHGSIYHEKSFSLDLPTGQWPQTEPETFRELHPHHLEGKCLPNPSQHLDLQVLLGLGSFLDQGLH